MARGLPFGLHTNFFPNQTHLFSYVFVLTWFLFQAEEWTFARCLCGSVIGKCKDVFAEIDGTVQSYTCYRFAKYSIRPSAPSSEYVTADLFEHFVDND